MSLLSTELQAKIAIWQARSEEGTITLEEQREFIILLRGERKNAIVEKKPSTRGKKAAKAPIDGEALLRELEGM